jgi:hypothetical protein
MLISIPEATHGERHVVPAEPEAVAQRHVDVALDGSVRHVVQVALGVGRPVIDRRRNGAVADGERADREFEPAGRASVCPVIDLVELTWSL